MKNLIQKLLLCLLILSVSGCSTVGFYYQSLKGQLDVISRRENIDDVLKNQATDPKVKTKLELVKQAREFAIQDLYLPESDSFTSYADLQRPYALWNVFAAPNLSIQPHTWCFPIVGCVVYRGYFSKDEALEYAKGLTLDENLDTYVAGVPAYSTLGWFKDPVLNTVLGYPDYELAGLVFHELAHELVYAKGDSIFNESFATAVQVVGIERWLAAQNREADVDKFRLQRHRDAEVIQLILSFRDQLGEMYQSTSTEPEKLNDKAHIINDMKQAYQKLIAQWPGYRRYGRWFEQEINNAHFVVISAYHDKVDTFLKLLEHHNNDLSAFYEVAAELAKKDEKEREEFLQQFVN